MEVVTVDARESRQRVVPGRSRGLVAGRDGPSLAEQVARIVHELRSPLAGASQALTLLERTPDRAPDPDVLEIARRQLEAGMRRVEQLLLLLREDAGRGGLSPAPHRLDALVRETANPRLHGGQPPVRVEIDPTLWVSVDPAAFAHVIENLLSNAHRHAPATSEIIVTAQAHGEEVLLRVIDHGDGIDPGLLEAAFEPFVRGGDGGAGLGLAIVRQVVEGHGGRVWIEIDPEQPGTCLVVALPAASPPQEASPGGERA